MTADAGKSIGTTGARRGAIDVAILVVVGLLMGFLAPFDSERAPVLVRYVYWVVCIAGVGLIGIGADAMVKRRLPRLWRRTLVVSVITTPPGTLLVLTTQYLLVSQPYGWAVYLNLLWQVFPILLAVMAVRALAWRQIPARIETRTIVEAPLPAAEAAFRRRLSARRRGAKLIAVEAHDHYLKVHTDAGEEMITLRFADALSELEMAHGWRVHRSWWVAADAVEGVRWRRGAGELRLIGGLTAPVSRSHAPVLKAAGWF